MGKTTLTWAYDGLVGEGFKIYRADSPMDPENLPLPIATVGIEDREYVDETVIDDETYYYRVASYAGGAERLSGEIEHIAEKAYDLHWDKVASLLRFDDEQDPWKDETGRVWTQVGSATVAADEGLYGGAFSKMGGLTGGARTASFVRGGPFTVEGWIFIPDYVTSGIISVLTQRQTSGGSIVSPRWEMVVRTSSLTPTPDDFYLATYNFGQSPENIYGDIPVPKQTWQHIAWSFDGTTIRFAVHGKIAAELPRTYPFASNTMAALGYFNSSSPSERAVDVKLDEIRVTVGVARYTEDFTPPAAPFPNFGPFSPRDIATELWLDAADSSTVTLTSGRVSQWADKSGNNRHATQGTSSRRPTYDADSGAIVFDGTRQLLTPNFHMAEGAFFFVAESYGDNGFTQHLSRRSRPVSPWGYTAMFRYQQESLGDRFLASFWGDDADAVDMYTATGVDRSLSVFSSVYDLSSGLSSSLQNGVEFANAPTEGALDNTSQGWGIGGSNAYSDTERPLYGTLREVIFVPNPTGVENRQKIEGYLAWKWGLVDKLPANHPYKLHRPM